MTRFFVDTGDGVHFVDTEAEARKLAAGCLAEFRECSRVDGEWPQEVEQVCWGEIREQVKAIYAGENNEYTDYELKAV
jgi:hypothetical protein